jgi:hypothetical protein
MIDVYLLKLNELKRFFLSISETLLRLSFFLGGEIISVVSTVVIEIMKIIFQNQPQ